MTTDRPHDVSYELGGINQQLEAITRTLSENRTADAQYRTGIRQEMKEQRAAINGVVNDLAIAKRDVSEMRPKVEVLEERMHMSKGAVNLAMVLSKAAHIISAAIGGAIVIILDKLVFHK